MVEERPQPLPEQVAAGQGFEVAPCDGLLGRHPGGDLRVAPGVVLEPAIGIGHHLAEMLLPEIGAARRRVLDAGDHEASPKRNGGIAGREPARDREAVSRP
jgi:hypothetical protein